MTFGKLQVGCLVPFIENWLLSDPLPYRPDWRNAGEKIILLEVSPLSTLELSD